MNGSTLTLLHWGFVATVWATLVCSAIAAAFIVGYALRSLLSPLRRSLPREAADLHSHPNANPLPAE